MRDTLLLRVLVDSQHVLEKRLETKCLDHTLDAHAFVHIHDDGFGSDARII